MQNITACIICKNEEIHIGNCIRALKKFNIPIVVTDTGSTDQTVPIVLSLLSEKDKLCHFTWINNFSAARNFCSAQAGTDWIWRIDADEILQTCDITALQAFLTNSNNPDKIGVITLKSRYQIQGANSYVITDGAHIYHKQQYHYEGIIHEQLVRNNAHISLSSSYISLPIFFEHLGYETPEISIQKSRRNIALLDVAYKKQKDPYLAYQLGNAYYSLGKYDTAVKYFSEGLSFDLDPNLQYVQQMVQLYGYSLLELKQYKTAISFEAIYDTFQNSAEFVFLMGLIYMNNALFDQAIAEFEKATTYPTCCVEGTNSYRAFYNIGVILECTGHIQEAIAFYQKCGNYLPAKERYSFYCS